MIVRNGANTLGALIGRESTRVSAGLLTKWDGTQTTSNTTVTLTILREDVLASNSGLTMKLGSGTTPVDFEDYCLESEIESTKYICNSAGSGSSSPTVTNDGKVAFTFTFTANENITVNELCLIYFESDGTKYMLARKNIPARNVTAGETFTFSYVLGSGSET